MEEVEMFPFLFNISCDLSIISLSLSRVVGAGRVEVTLSHDLNGVRKAAPDKLKAEKTEQQII